MRGMRTFLRLALVGVLCVLLLAACGGGSPDPQKILNESFTAMEGLESIHFETRMEFLPSAESSEGDPGISEPFTITTIGDFQGPDHMRFATSGVFAREFITIGSTQYSKYPGGQWVSKEASAEDQGDLFALWTILDPSQIRDLIYAGEEAISGVPTHYLTGLVPEGSMPDLETDLTIEFWVGVEDNLWRQVRSETELASPEGVSQINTLQFAAFGEFIAIEAPEPIALLLQILSISPTQARPDEPFTISFTAQNGIDAPLSTTVDLLINDETVETFTVSDLAPGASQTFDLEVARSEPGTYRMQIAGGPSFTLLVMGLLVTDLSISAETVGPNKPVTIELVTENVTDAALSTTVDLLINDATAETFTVSDLAPGASRTFTTEVARAQPRSYRVEVEGPVTGVLVLSFSLLYRDGAGDIGLFRYASRGSTGRAGHGGVCGAERDRCTPQYYRRHPHQLRDGRDPHGLRPRSRRFPTL